MNPLKLLKHLNFRTGWTLLKLVLCHLLFVWPSYKATVDCLRWSTLNFGRKHYQNGPANAFRHALWNYLIALYCTKWSKNRPKILAWTKAITDWHEDTFPNRALARKMDLHNNQVGRDLFEQHQTTDLGKVLEHLLAMTEKSIRIDYDSKLEVLKTQLVHICDQTCQVLET